jgi:glycerophosphoryl diester phosphodiesterase
MTPVLLGHRGDPSHHAENTQAGFMAAIACGADGVELDVQLSADGVPVVLHDDTLDRTTPGHGRVDAHTWQQLDGLGVPRLEDALVALRGHVVAAELKPPYDLRPSLAAHVLDTAHRLDLAATLWLLSFDHRHLQAARAHDTAITTAALVRDRPRDAVAVVDACRATMLAPWWEHVDEPMLDALRRAGRGLLAWTVDTEEAALRLAGLGVAGLVSNRPCALAPLLRGGQ